jgi:hypothetical protein
MVTRLPTVVPVNMHWVREINWVLQQYPNTPRRLRVEDIPLLPEGRCPFVGEK